MKNIIIAALLVSSSLMAVDGQRAYEQHCLRCHGENAKKTPGTAAPLAGRDEASLVVDIREYINKREKVGCFYNYKDSEVMEVATYYIDEEQIAAIAKYISSLK